MAKANNESQTIHKPLELQPDTEVFALDAEMESAFADWDADDTAIDASTDDAASDEGPADDGTAKDERESGAEKAAPEKDEQGDKEKVDAKEPKTYSEEQYQRSRAEANRQRDKAMAESANLARQLAELRQELERAKFDREVYLRATDRLKQRADSPEGVSFRDVESETREAFEEVARQMREREGQARQHEAAQAQQAIQQQAMLQQRNLEAATNYNRVIAELMQETIKSNVTNLDIVDLFAKAADDPDIKADIEEWRNPEISPERAAALIQRIHRAGAKAVRGRIEQERDRLKAAREKAAAKDQEPDRRAIHGDASGGVSPVPPMPEIWSVSAELENAFAGSR